MELTDYIILTTGDDCRIICVSDIHGNLDLFVELLEKCDYRVGEDWLFILGDIVEKGARSLDTLNYVMELSHNERVVVTLGNLEWTPLWLLNDASVDEAMGYFAARPVNLVADMAREIGLESVTADKYDEVRTAVRERFACHLDYIKNLPTVVETEDFIFSHGGVDKADWRECRKWDFVKHDDFFRYGRSPCEKWAVAGHLPVYNCVEAGSSDNPVVIDERNIILIDGGNAVKSIGQLNAFIVDKCAGRLRFDYRFTDAHRQVVVRADYLPVDDGYDFIKTVWPDFGFEVLSHGEYFSVCRLNSTGATGYVKNEHIRIGEDGCSFAYNSTSMFLSVRAGDVVYVIDDACAGFVLVKNMAGLIGWISRDAVDR